MSREKKNKPEAWQVKELLQQADEIRRQPTSLLDRYGYQAPLAMSRSRNCVTGVPLGTRSDFTELSTFTPEIVSSIIPPPRTF